MHYESDGYSVAIGYIVHLISPMWRVSTLWHDFVQAAGSLEGVIY